MDYILRISGDFEKGECGECPLAVNTYVIDGNYYPQCPLGKDEVTCPLEEATVAKNATVEGEWIAETFYTYEPIKFDENGKLVSHPRTVYICNKCGRIERKKEPYCNCGAKMKGGK